MKSRTKGDKITHTKYKHDQKYNKLQNYTIERTANK